MAIKTNNALLKLNRLTAGGSNYTYTHNKLNGVLHDSAGNITNMVRNGVTLDLTWHSQGQLTSVSTNGNFAESYTWGPLGNRLSTTDASGTTYHAYDGSQCIADYNSSGDLIASYTWGSGIDNLLAVTVYESTATNTYYAVKDHLNSVHALIDDSGNTVMTVSYDAWGTPLNSSFSIQNSSFKLRYLFQGREYSQATGLYNFRARWYSSYIGRWLSKDPIGLEGGLNLYVFCGNDPVNYRDPAGLCKWEDWDFEYGTDDFLHDLDMLFGNAKPQNRQDEIQLILANHVLLGSVSPSALIGKGYPTKLNAAGKLQPYDPVNGQYMSYSANPGLVHSPLGRFGAGLAQGWAESQGATGSTPVGTAGEIGHAIGSLAGSLFQW